MGALPSSIRRRRLRCGVGGSVNCCDSVLLFVLLFTLFLVVVWIDSERLSNTSTGRTTFVVVVASFSSPDVHHHRRHRHQPYRSSITSTGGVILNDNNDIQIVAMSHPVASRNVGLRMTRRCLGMFEDAATATTHQSLQGRRQGDATAAVPGRSSSFLLPRRTSNVVNNNRISSTSLSLSFSSTSSSSSSTTSSTRYLSTKVSPLHATASGTILDEQLTNNATEAGQPLVVVDKFPSLASSPTTAAVLREDDLGIEVVENNIIINEDDDVLAGLTSRPKKGGNWDPSAPLKWTENFGRRSKEDEQRLMPLTQLGPGDDGYFDVSDITVPQVTIVRTKEQARIVMECLMNADPSIFHACDTEVMDIDLKQVGPVGNGYVTCVSIHSGPDFDYGLGDGPGTTLWIDNLDDAHGVLQEFKEWFEDDRFLKVWHNYGFDRHVMWNEGINCKGFGGDTMHMARLQDTSRSKNGSGYSLEALTGEMLSMRKRPMKEIFGVPRIKKDGTPGSLVDVPPVEVLQRDPRFRRNFIIYSCYDAVGTYDLHEHLTALLKDMTWISEDTNLYDYYFNNMRQFGEVLTDMERRGIQVDAKDYLASVERQARKDRVEHSKKFREWAAKEIGIDGLAINPSSSLQLNTFLFGGAANQKTRQPTESEKVFKIAREEIPDDALEAFNKRDEEKSKKNKKKGTVMSDELDQMKAVQLKELCKANGLKVSGKKADLQERLREYFLSGPPEDPPSDDFDDMTDEELRLSMIGRNLDDRGEREELLKRLRDDIQYMRELENAIPHGVPRHQTIAEALENAAQNDGTVQGILAEIREKANEVPKHVEITIRSIGMQPGKYTAGGAPSVTADVLRGLAGDPFDDPPRYGTAYDFFGGGDRGHDACVALFSLCSIGSIGTSLSARRIVTP
jgi:SAP domain/3'-5' exonuclease